MKNLMITAALGLLVVPAAGAAETRNATAPAASANAAAETKICLTMEATGSRVVKVECKTKAQWSRLGVQLDDLSKK